MASASQWLPLCISRDVYVLVIPDFAGDEGDVGCIRLIWGTTRGPKFREGGLQREWNKPGISRHSWCGADLTAPCHTGQRNITADLWQLVWGIKGYVTRSGPGLLVGAQAMPNLDLAQLALLAVQCRHRLGCGWLLLWSYIRNSSMKCSS
jgi:hypothetical protein